MTTSCYRQPWIKLDASQGLDLDSQLPHVFLRFEISRRDCLVSSGLPQIVRIMSNVSNHPTLLGPFWRRSSTLQPWVGSILAATRLQRESIFQTGNPMVVLNRQRYPVPRREAYVRFNARNSARLVGSSRPKRYFPVAARLAYHALISKRYGGLAGLNNVEHTVDVERADDEH